VQVACIHLVSNPFLNGFAAMVLIELLSAVITGGSGK